MASGWLLASLVTSDPCCLVMLSSAPWPPFPLARPYWPQVDCAVWWPQHTPDRCPVAWTEAYTGVSQPPLHGFTVPICVGEQAPAMGTPPEPASPQQSHPSAHLTVFRDRKERVLVWMWSNWKCKVVQMGNSLAIPPMVKHNVTTWPSNSTLQYRPQRKWTSVHIKTCKWMFKETSFMVVVK